MRWRTLCDMASLYSAKRRAAASMHTHYPKARAFLYFGISFARRHISSKPSGKNRRTLLHGLHSTWRRKAMDPCHVAHSSLLQAVHEDIQARWRTDSESPHRSCWAGKYGKRASVADVQVTLR